MTCLPVFILFALFGQLAACRSGTDQKTPAPPSPTAAADSVPANRTAEGLGIGAILGQVKPHYPIAFLGPGETEIVAVTDGQKITFMPDVSHLPDRDVPRLHIQNTPDSVKVLGMLV